VTEETGAIPTPYILDVSVLTAIARGDSDISGLILELDARGRPLVVPVLAMAAAALDVRSADADATLHGLEQLDHAEVAVLRDADQAARLASVVARTGLDPWDAQVAAVADASICPILTLDADKWRALPEDQDAPRHVIEISDPGEPGQLSIFTVAGQRRPYSGPRGGTGPAVTIP
jgi:predicted nucleic acid-binding protein